MLSGVIFDMDGVLLDSHPAHLEAWRSFFSELGTKVSDCDLNFVLDGRKRQDILQHFLGELDPDTLAVYGARKDAHFMSHAESVRPLPGIVGFLEELQTHGISAAVATSAAACRATALLDRFDLSRYFKAVVTGGDVRDGKPHPAIFELAASWLDRPVEELLVFEDAVSGIKGARAAGIRCVGIGNEKHAAALISAGAEAVVPDFVGLRPDKLADKLWQDGGEIVAAT